jgi:DNA topoisomerase VI subunit B
MIVLGEALQNAIDAVCEQTKFKKGKISVEIDFDSETVKVTDNGGGFPKNISLLYLGGGTKSEKKLKGKVGVGIKVSMFSSEYFCIRSNLGDGTLKVELNNCYSLSFP